MGRLGSCIAMIPTMVVWTFAPEWLTPAAAARLLGPIYSEADAWTLIEIGAVDVRETADGVLIEKRSLWEYAESLREVLTDGGE